MKPNIFVDSTHCPEDWFSHALAYVLNLFPSTADRFIDRIGALAGKQTGYFGRFERCDFVGHEFPEGHRTSKPDLRLVCAARTIYFENKLDSPLSVPQLERHADLVGSEPKSYLMFVSNIRHQSPRLRSLRRYIHPKGADHYLWVELLPALEVHHRKGSFPAQILSDFRAASKTHGMVGRTIKGAVGSLYTAASDASHVALTRLSEVLLELGFKVARKQGREGTLRLYPVRHREYPLLNPRFYATAAWLDSSLDLECLVFTVISKGGERLLMRRLATFVSRPDCKFVPDPFVNVSGYTYHGYFVLPVKFSHERAGSVIDFAALADPLKRILRALAT